MSLQIHSSLRVLSASVIGFLLCFSSSLAGADLRLTVKEAQKAKLEFGKSVNVHFVVKNNSPKAVIVKQIKPLKTGNKTLNLSGSVHGSISKERGRDAFHYSPMAQEETRHSFYAGLLLPGEKFIPSSSYRPISKEEKFKVTYYKTENSYSNSENATQRLQIYIRESEKKDSGSPRYVPFSESRWKGIKQESQSIQDIGPDNSFRSVLIPELPDKSQVLKFRVNFNYKGSPLLLEDAKRIASQISGRKSKELRLAYSNALNCYVVFGDTCSWTLKSAQQKTKGDLLPVFPPALLNDIDSSEYVLIKVGEKQKGFGPEVKKANRMYWNNYEVYYGDGKYTRGQFLHITKKQLLEFLRQAKEKGKTLSSTSYYFNSRYYTIKAAE